LGPFFIALGLLGEKPHAFFQPAQGQWVHLVFHQLAHDVGRGGVVPGVLGVGVDPDKLLVLPNPIDLDSLIKKSECSVDFPENITPGEYFVSVARLTHQKNIHLLLRSFAKARELGCKWPLVIIGDGEDRVNLLALSNELSLDKDVHFLGYQTNPHPFLVKAGAFTMSSREEGFPVSLLEGMALGCPIISLACPTGPTDILHNGKLGKLIPFTEDNPNELGLAMFDISNNAVLRKNYAEESKFFAQNFSSQIIAQQLMILLRNIASNQRP